MAGYDLVIRGGTVVTAAETMRADVGISGEAVAAIARDLEPGKREIDASGKLVMPGGIDAHAHIEQLTSSGVMAADDFETGTAAAAFGGTTTVMCFAAQHVGMSLAAVTDDYMRCAERGAIVDYAFHLIVADPTEQVLTKELPALVKAGHATVKVYMTYDRLKLNDEQLLDVLQASRDNGAFALVHAENYGMITWMSKRLVGRGYVAPRYHAVSHPRSCEPEAINRLVACAALVDQPIMIYHVSTAEGAAAIRQARGEGLKVYAETCPQYLFLTKHDLDRPGVIGTKWMCSPPLREASDQEALWQALALGDLQIVSSDHAPYRFDETGKLSAGKTPTFKQVANGMPGLEERLPLMFDAMVSQGRFGANQFVAWTATEPAKIYGLYPKKGSITIGGDADIAIWDPGKKVALSDDSIHAGARYTAYAGRTVTGWPVTVLRRGVVIVSGGGLHAAPGSGRFLPREPGFQKPLGRPVPEMDPVRNFNAELR